jgi:hypothetical protein
MADLRRRSKQDLGMALLLEVVKVAEIDIKGIE